MFDSLLKGFPIGSFLFWTVKAENTKNYDFYHFVQHYHERDSRHNPKADLTASGDVTAVLDGQQRLTSLYIALRGTYAYRKARHRKTSDSAYPPRRLYLNLTRASDDPELTYSFEFREDSKDVVKDADGDSWFRVGKVLDLPDAWDAITYLGQQGLADHKFARETMAALHKAVCTATSISFYLERTQELDRVLSIFVRVNSGGTVLSYSDLLLSIATAEWTDLDARETIYRLVDEINRLGRSFLFTKDFVLKTCLMLGDFETRFSTASFTSANMKIIEKKWPLIESAVRTTVDLLVGYGLSGETLPSVNAVVPIVYYVATRDNPAGFSTSKAFNADRERIRRWLNIALLKRTFTGQPDSILRTVRDTIKGHGHTGFPGDEIIAALATNSRNMRVEESDLDKILDETYGSGYAFATLGLLYPTLDLRNVFHEDHIHPQSQFTPKRLERAGLTPAQIEEYVDRRDTIPNLQLLGGMQNQEKSARSFQEWFNAQFAEKPDERDQYRRLHYIPDVELRFANFVAFHDARRELMRKRLREIIGIPPGLQASAIAGVASAVSTTSG
jgi:hypothetical protein